MFFLSYCFSTGMVTARMALWHCAYKTECYMCSSLGRCRVYFFESWTYWLDVISYICFVILKNFTYPLTRIANKDFTINSICMLGFCEVNGIYSENMKLLMYTQVGEVLYIIFSGFLCLSLLIVLQFYFLVRKHARFTLGFFPHSVSILHLLLLVFK